MTDDESDRPRSRRWIVVIALPVSYVMSIGPANGMLFFLANQLPSAALEAPVEFMVCFYTVAFAPLICATDYMPWLAKMLEWYIECFI